MCKDVIVYGNGGAKTRACDGSAFGALTIGIVADAFGLLAGFWFAAAIMTVSGLVVALLMYETLPSRRVVHLAWEQEPCFGAARPEAPGNQESEKQEAR